MSEQHIGHEIEEIEEILTHIYEVVLGNHHKLNQIQQEVAAMAVDQATFDAELGALVQAITDLGSAIDAFIAAQPAGVDLSAEAQSVADASAAVAAELAKVSPAPAVPVDVPPPADVPPPDVPPADVPPPA